MTKNPFNEWSEDYKVFETLSDLKWHCSKCDFNSTQPARNFKNIRDAWFEMEKEWKNYEKQMFCEKCWRNRWHRKLKSLIQISNSIFRSTMPESFKKRVKDLYNWEEAFFLRKLPYDLLEVDHKFPQVRWSKNEENLNNLTDQQIKDKFLLLTRSNNLWKSRICENCVRNFKRGLWEKDLFYNWNEKWAWININDEKWCVWCFFYDPYKWREKLNKKITWN